MLAATPHSAATTRQAATPHSIAYAQNFLRDPRLVAYLLDNSSITAADCVLEIGPGRGIITAQLARRCRRVIAVEKDVDLARLLRDRFAACPAVTIHSGDVRYLPLPTAPYKVFANVPFNITTEIIRGLTEGRRPPDDAFLVVQREAAQRFLGQPCESLRSVLLKPWFEPSLLHQFKRGDFIPPPQVEVVMLRLRKRGPPLLRPDQAPFFRDVTCYLFSAWQPTLRAALRGILTPRQVKDACRRLDLPYDLPPSALPFAGWLDLFCYVESVATSPARRVIMGSEARLIRLEATRHKRHRTRGACTDQDRHTRHAGSDRGH